MRLLPVPGLSAQGSMRKRQQVVHQLTRMQLQRSYSVVSIFIATMAVYLVSFTALAQSKQRPAFEPPRVIRYISSLIAHRGETCFGLVQTDDKGIPTLVRVLSDYYAQLCHAGDDSRYAQPQLMRWAFEAAEATALNAQQRGADDELSEFLPQERLAEIVLPPVPISVAELDRLQRVVIGAGINYAEHRDEVGIIKTREMLLFPKPVRPTGAYSSVHTGMQIGEVPGRPVLLLDYEVELGMVLLKDIDLRNPPADYASFIDSVAFFVANDVSDREPIILDDKTGYTHAKSHPTYLPIGPWMIHGRNLQPYTSSEGKHSLEIGLSVSKPSPATVGDNPEVRQLAHSDDMLRGPWAIIKSISETFLRGEIVCMRDADGQPRYIHNADGIIPAGSIVLTGTPGGTAIRKPGLWQKIELFFRGGFSLAGARRMFVEKSEQHVVDSNYLRLGDRVEGWVEHLGRQRWTVVADAQPKPYGIISTSACDAGTLPHPVSYK